MKKIIISFALMAITTLGFTQDKVYSTKTGKVSFLCQSKAEKIEAVNNQVSCKLSKKGQLVFLMLIKGFKFDNSTMEEHFNDNYMETSKFPKADFKGNITNVNTVNFEKDGSYAVTATGDLTIHGTTKKVSANGTIVIKDGKATLNGKLTINIKDYGIKGEYIGSTIASDAQLTINCKLD